MKTLSNRKSGFAGFAGGGKTGLRPVPLRIFMNKSAPLIFIQNTYNIIISDMLNLFKLFFMKC